MANVSNTLRGPAPSVLRMAMSVCFSFTIMTSVATMLKAATATIISRITNMIDFCISMDRKKLAWSSAQRKAHPRNGVAESVEPRRVLKIDQRQPTIELVHPGLKDPADRELPHA